VWTKTIPPRVIVTGKVVIVNTFAVSVVPTSCEKKYTATNIRTSSKPANPVTISGEYPTFDASIFLDVTKVLAMT